MFWCLRKLVSNGHGGCLTIICQAFSYNIAESGALKAKFEAVHASVQREHCVVRARKRAHSSDYVTFFVFQSAREERQSNCGVYSDYVPRQGRSRQDWERWKIRRAGFMKPWSSERAPFQGNVNTDAFWSFNALAFSIPVSRSREAGKLGLTQRYKIGTLIQRHVQVVAKA